MTAEGSGASHLQQVVEVKTCAFHSFDSLIAYFRVENPSDKFFLMYLLLEIIVLLAGVHLALNSGVHDVLEVLLHKLKLFLMSRWVRIVMQGACGMCSSLGALELPILDATQEGLRGMQIFLCGI